MKFYAVLNAFSVPAFFMREVKMDRTTELTMLVEIERFCAAPYSEHGKRTRQGPAGARFKFIDWEDLVERISEIRDKTTCAPEIAKRIAQALRKEFPNNKDTWDKQVSRPGASERILAIILNALDSSQ